MVRVAQYEPFVCYNGQVKHFEYDWHFYVHDYTRRNAYLYPDGSWHFSMHEGGQWGYFKTLKEVANLLRKMGLAYDIVLSFRGIFIIQYIFFSL